MPKTFSRLTLEKFEAASASIPLRQIDRAFRDAEIRLGEDPGGPVGDRRTQFRRYVASVDQRDPQQQERLGGALGALIEAVAASKEEFLKTAAAHDGFNFAKGRFRPAQTAWSSFTVTGVDDLPFVADRGRRLYLLANDSPSDAVAGATELVVSCCRTALSLAGRPLPEKISDIVDNAVATLNALDALGAGSDATTGADLVERSLAHLAALVFNFSEPNAGARHARLVVGAAVTFADFVAEIYLQQA